MTKRVLSESAPAAPAAPPSALKKQLFDYDKLRIVDHVYTMGKKIASGTAGVVYNATTGPAGAGPCGPPCAIKQYKQRGDHWEGELYRELECIRMIQPHPNVLGFIEVMTSPTRDSLYVAMELMPFDLAGLMRLRGADIAIGEVKGYMKQLLMGVAHIHAAGVMHRDLKPENILVTADNVVKLADFGLCHTVKRESGSPYHTNMVTTIWYRAPELLLFAPSAVPKSRYTPAIDVWSVGCIMGEFMLGGHMALFRSAATRDGTDNPVRQLELIYELCGTPRRDQLHEWSEELRPLLAASFRSESTSKLRTSFATRSKRAVFFTPSALDALSAMLCLNPRARASAKGVLAMPFFALDAPLPYPPQVIKRMGGGAAAHGREQK